MTYKVSKLVTKKPKMTAEVHEKCEAAIKDEFERRVLTESKLSNARTDLKELRRALEPTWSAIPEGRKYLKKMDEAIYD